MPATATAVSFGLNLFTNGTLTTDDLSMVQTGTPAAAPAALRSGSGRRRPQRPFANAALSAVTGDPTRGPHKNKGDKITTHNTVPGPEQPGPSRQDRRSPRAAGIAPGAVVLPPFVVSPETDPRLIARAGPARRRRAGPAPHSTTALRNSATTAHFENYER